MAYDLEEQESIDQMKAWWEKWGTPITAAVCVVCFSFAGWNGWQWWQRKQADEGAVLFAQYQQAVMAQNNVQMENLAQTLFRDYSKTIYAPMTAMSEALIARKAGKMDLAVRKLQWIVQDDRYPEYEAVVRVRLASLLLQEKKFRQALQRLHAIRPTERQEIMVQDRLADVYLAQGESEKARSTWENLLARADIKNHPLRRLIELKLASIPTKQGL